jgi:TolA-binding protein
MGPAQISPGPSTSVAMGGIAAAMSAGAATPAAPAPKDTDSARPSSRSATAHPTTGGSASWQALARASRFREAFDLARDNGFDGELDRASVQDLLLLGDAARLSGNAPYAIRAYQRARSRAPGTPWAANAAFALGRVYFDQLDSFGDAARWFATYSSEAPSGPLAREALGRRMEALSRGGDRSGAARVAEQYLRQYPSGPHAPLARTLETEEN